MGQTPDSQARPRPARTGCNFHSLVIGRNEAGVSIFLVANPLWFRYLLNTFFLLGEYSKENTMNRMETMSAAARNAMDHVLDLVPADHVLVVTDRTTDTCGQAFATGAAEHGCFVEIYHLPEEGRPLQEMPAAMPGLLQGTSVVCSQVRSVSPL